MLSTDSSKLEQLRKNTTQFRETMTKAGFEISGQNHPISPVMLYDARVASEFANEMLEQGAFLSLSTLPPLPPPPPPPPPSPSPPPPLPLLPPPPSLVSFSC